MNNILTEKQKEVNCIKESERKLIQRTKERTYCNSLQK